MHHLKHYGNQLTCYSSSCDRR